MRRLHAVLLFHVLCVVFATLSNTATAQESLTAAQLLEHWRTTALPPVQVKVKQHASVHKVNSRSPFGNKELIAAGTAIPASEYIFTYIKPESMRLDSLSLRTTSNVLQGQSQHLIQSKEGSNFLYIDLDPREGSLLPMALTTTILQWVNPLATAECDGIAKLSSSFSFPIQKSDRWGDTLSVHAAGKNLILARAFDWRPVEIYRGKDNKAALSQTAQYAYQEGRLVLKEVVWFNDWSDTRCSIQDTTFEQVIEADVSIKVPENTFVKVNR